MMTFIEGHAPQCDALAVRQVKGQVKGAAKVKSAAKVKDAVNWRRSKYLVKQKQNKQQG